MTQSPTANQPAGGHAQRSAALLFIHAQTALHPGGGTAMGVIDLPVERERHTAWPVIPGTALKGVLRDAVREGISRGNPGGGDSRDSSSGSLRKQADNDPELTAIFGPPLTGADEHAGALGVADARILAFPVRSMKGVFAWVTCMDALHRLMRDADLTGTGLKSGDLSAGPAADAALVSPSSPLLIDGSSLLLEEFAFAATNPSAALCGFIGEIAARAFRSAASQERFRTHLVILHPDDFTHFARHATQVQARIALDYESKTVSEGALFYEEFLPPETLLYAPIFATASRNRNKKMDAAAVLGAIQGVISNMPYLQIGGGQTTGHGICSVTFFGPHISAEEKS